jgi:hypothetical protein
MKRTFLPFLVAILFCSLAMRVQAQSDLQTQLQKISGSAGQSYVAPVVNGFGTNLNGGWFHGAPKTSLLGIDIQIGVVVMGTPFKDDEKTFSSTGTFRFNQDQASQIVSQYGNIPAAARPTIIQQISAKDYTVSIAGPTATGTPYDAAHPSHSNQVYVRFPGDAFTVNGTTYQINPVDQGQGIGGIKQLQSLSTLPLAAPQITIGTVYGTQATLRYLPAMSLTNAVGKVKYVGFGIQHNASRWFPGIPVDVSLSYFTQKLTIDPYVEAKGSAFGLTASRQFGLGILNVTPYGGFSIEKSNMAFTYNQTGTFVVNNIAVQNLPINFSVDGANTSRLTIGANFRLLYLNINADYNIGKYKSFTGGLMFII